MKKENKMEYTYFDAYNKDCFELEMTLDDAKFCAHQGCCDKECEQMVKKPYIREQLNKLTSEQMEAAIRVYDVNFEEYESKEIPREDLELYIVWLAASDIVDNI